MRQFPRLLCSSGLVASAVACVGTSRVADIAATIPDSDAAAFVGPERATFVFPREARTSFAWPLDSSQDASDRFAWGVTILTGDTAFLPGGVALRSAHPASFTSLVELIRAVQPKLRYNPGGHAQFTDDRARVRVRAVTGRVVIEIEGRDQIQRVFRARPATVRFGAVAPTAPTWREIIIAVQYQPGWDASVLPNER